MFYFLKWDGGVKNGSMAFIYIFVIVRGFSSSMTENYLFHLQPKPNDTCFMLSTDTVPPGINMKKEGQDLACFIIKLL